MTFMIDFYLSSSGCFTKDFMALWNDSDSSKEWLVLGCVIIIYKTLTFSVPYSLENLIKQAYILRVSPDPLISYSLCLVSGQISDLALKLSFSTNKDKVLAYL